MLKLLCLYRRLDYTLKNIFGLYYRIFANDQSHSTIMLFNFTPVMCLQNCHYYQFIVTVLAQLFVEKNCLRYNSVRSFLNFTFTFFLIIIIIFSFADIFLFHFHPLLCIHYHLQSNVYFISFILIFPFLVFFFLNFYFIAIAYFQIYLSASSGYIYQLNDS